MPQVAAMWYYLARPSLEAAYGYNPPPATAPPWMALCMDPCRTSHCQESPLTHTNGTKHAHGEGTASPLPFTPQGRG